MKQLKRAAAVLLAVCLIFSLAACGGVNIDKTAKNLHIKSSAASDVYKRQGREYKSMVL